MKCLVYLIAFILLTQSNAAISVLVNTTGYASPYYTFSTDDGATTLDFTSGGSDSLLKGVEYTFTAGNDNHPFKMYITDSLGNDTILINSLVGRSSESFTLASNIDYTTYTKTYLCVSHPSDMVGSFNIVPETSSYPFILGVIALNFIALRRRYTS